MFYSRVPNCFVDETSNVLLLTKDLKGFTGPKDDRQKSIDAFKSLLEGHNILNLVTEVFFSLLLLQFFYLYLYFPEK